MLPWALLDPGWHRFAIFANTMVYHYNGIVSRQQDWGKPD